MPLSNLKDGISHGEKRVLGSGNRIDQGLVVGKGWGVRGSKKAGGAGAQ